MAILPPTNGGRPPERFLAMLRFDEPLGLDRRHAARTRCGDGLPIHAVLHVAGQLTANFVIDHYEVAGDTNGDGTADFIINVFGAVGPAAGDFLL